MYIKVLVTPGARKESVAQGKGDELIIMVREPAERNMANTRVRQIMAERLGKSLAQVRILTGHHSRSKMLSISD